MNKVTRRLALNEKSALFLELVAQSKTLLCGTDIVEMSNQIIKRGSVFAIATALERDNMIKSHTEKFPDSEFPRRLYQLTATGRIALKAWYDIQTENEKSLAVA